MDDKLHDGTIGAAERTLSECVEKMCKDLWIGDDDRDLLRRSDEVFVDMATGSLDDEEFAAAWRELLGEFYNRLGGRFRHFKRTVDGLGCRVSLLARHPDFESECVCLGAVTVYMKDTHPGAAALALIAFEAAIGRGFPGAV